MIVIADLDDLKLECENVGRVDVWQKSVSMAEKARLGTVRVFSHSKLLASLGSKVYLRDEVITYLRYLGGGCWMPHGGPITLVLRPWPWH